MTTHVFILESLKGEYPITLAVYSSQENADAGRAKFVKEGKWGDDDMWYIISGYRLDHDYLKDEEYVSS